MQGRPDQELIQTMLLRSMRQAVYQSENLGHFGLALESYSHFTSPIRRYPDLVIHRVIKAILAKQAKSANENNEANVGFYEYSPEEVIELGEQCSMTERRADDATRDVSDWLKCEFMQDHVGDTFTGVISTVTNFGLFVRLTDLHIEGLIHITSLGHDYYHFDDVRMCLSGEKKIDLVLSGEKSSSSHIKSGGKTKPKNTGLRKNSDNGFNTSRKTSDKDKSKDKPKKNKDKKTDKSKAKKRTARKKRPGKNARKTAE